MRIFFSAFLGALFAMFLFVAVDHLRGTPIQELPQSPQSESVLCKCGAGCDCGDYEFKAKKLKTSFVAPDKPEPKKEEKEPPVPNIAGQIRYGVIVQDGRKIRIEGDQYWFVLDGLIRKDGILEVVWIHRSEGRTAPGEYTIDKDGGIAGHWAWGDSVTVNDDGQLIGLTNPEVLREPAAPMIEQ